jgi:predicted AAA+ superfamily ATPase
VERDIMARLAAWKDSTGRKPLVLTGPRQAGKTWVLKEFGRRKYDRLAYFNFETDPGLGELFDATRQPERLIRQLELIGGQPLTPGDTLIVFDEVQASASALASLKYFREVAPAQHVAAAGSLLGVALAREASFPVGQVTSMRLGPMTFAEFLRATGEAGLADYLAETAELAPIPSAFAATLTQALKSYFVTGGMPEPVARWAANHDVAEVEAVLGELIGNYEADFAKHMEPKDFPKARLVWQSLPSQLGRANAKFLYQTVKPGARAREYEDSIQWLADAGLVIRVNRAKRPGLPLSAYDDLSAFKLFALDVGVLRRLGRLPASAFTEGSRLFAEFRGALTENYVLQALIPQLDATPRYWSWPSPPQEVDFVVQLGADIVPVEAKAGENLGSRSLRYYAAKYPEATPLRVRFSLAGLRLDGAVLNIPLYLADQAARLIGLALAGT